MAEWNAQRITNHGPTGNQVNTVGSHARVGLTVRQAADVLAGRGEAELAELLRRLQDAVTAEGDALVDPDEVQDAVDSVAEQLGGRRNRLTLLGTLTAISAAATSATSVAAAAEALTAALR